MALLWVPLLLLFSSLLQTPAYKLPALQLSGQDDPVRGLAADGDSQPASRGQSVSDAVGARAADFPVFLRGKREAEVQSSNHSAEETTAGHSNVFATTLWEHTGEETESFPTLEPLDESDPPGNFYDDKTAIAEPWSVATSAEMAGVPAGNHLNTTSPTLSTSSLSSEVDDDGTEEIPTSSMENRENGPSIRRAKAKAPGETSPTLLPETPRESSGISTEPPVKESAVSRPGPIMVGKTNSSCLMPLAGSSVTGKTHLQMPSEHMNILVGKCLLAIFILALVAGVFIVCTAVLATLLWRQKHVSRARQSNATEMVCISALLPDSEPLANGGKPSKVKRMKLPMDNCSETDADNLTLNSFLPDH
uniref:P-selectin glycoprotein ligand 1 n=1 Tax=Pelusios castaneus TaxID=367368 RepID=A0A8C8RWT2_9SAUR